MLKKISNEISLLIDSKTQTAKVNSDTVSLYDVLLCFIAVASATAMILLCFDFFDIPVMLAGSLGIVCIVVYFVKKINIIDLRFCSVIFVLILIFAIIFRTGDFTYYYGGQDQGLYVNMSETIVRDKSINFHDSFGASLPDDDILIDNYTTAFMGSSVSDSENHLIQIDFYPLNSVWMAVSKFFFGMGNHGFAIQFFSILTIIGIYLLTLELTDYNFKTAYLAYLFAALNPALVFFSKFPVTETVAMAFSVNGFYFLLRAVKSKNKKSSAFYYFTSAMLLGMFNFVRMSFILYLPIMALILVIPFTIKKYANIRLPVFCHVSLTIALYILSWFWYYNYQPTLFGPMYNILFGPFLERYKFVIIALLLIMVISIVLALKYKEKTDRAANWISDKISIIAPYLIIAVFVVFLFRIYQLCTEGYLVDGIPFVAGGEITNFRFSSLYRFIQIISPFMFVIFLIVPFLKIKFSKIQLLLIISLTVFWTAITINNWVILYNYYYSRYVTSDIVLYSLIYISIILTYMLDAKKLKKITGIVIVSYIGYSCVFSGLQIGRAETETTDIYTAIDEIVCENDVLLSFETYAVNTPIKYYFNKPVYQLNNGNSALNSEIINTFYNYSKENRYSDIYILTRDNYSTDDKSHGLEYIGKYLYEYSFFDDTKHGTPFEGVKLSNMRQLLLPSSYTEHKGFMYLYKLINYYKVTLPVPQVIPTEIGETIITSGLYEHLTLNANYGTRNDEYYLESISDAENYLVFGPYQEAKSGQYNISFSTVLPERSDDTKLAEIVIKAESGKEVLAVVPLFTGDSTVDFSFDLPTNYSDIEISLKTFATGIVFKGYEITKIE